MLLLHTSVHTSQQLLLNLSLREGDHEWPSWQDLPGNRYSIDCRASLMAGFSAWRTLWNPPYADGMLSLISYMSRCTLAPAAPVSERTRYMEERSPERVTCLVRSCKCTRYQA